MTVEAGEMLGPPRLSALRGTPGVAFVAVWALMVVPVAVSLVWAATVVGLDDVRWPLVAALGFYLIVAGVMAFVVARSVHRAICSWLDEARSPDAGFALARLNALPPDLAEVRSAYLAAIETRKRSMRSLQETAATIVHDLKAPVIGIRNVVRMMDADAPGIAGADAVLRERLLAEVEQLARQVTHGVETLRSVGGHELTRVARVDLGVLLRDAVRRIDTRGVRVEVSGSATCKGDADLLGRAMFNLVENAVRYADALVTVEVLPGLVRIADDGPGLPAPLENLVQPFAGGGRLTNAGLGGLGLAMAYGALQAHGGRLVLERSDNRGTVLLAYVGRAAGGADDTGR